MKRFVDTVTEYLARTAANGNLPEHRDLKLYSNSSGYQLLGDDQGCPGDLPQPRLLDPLAAFTLLDSYFESRNPDLEGKTYRQRYLELPRADRIDKLVGQIYRLLRIYRMALLHPDGVIEQSRGYLRAACVTRGTAFNLILTKAGLTLAQDFVTCYFNLLRLPYGEAYREALLSQYYVDLATEVKKFHDEDADLMRFHNRYQFNRHVRFDCGSPKYVIQGERLVFELADSYCNPLRYPIDFFILVEDQLHIIPIEALQDKGLPLAELPRWREQKIDANQASAQWLLKFGHKTTSNGGPMA